MLCYFRISLTLCDDDFITQKFKWGAQKWSDKKWEAQNGELENEELKNRAPKKPPRLPKKKFSFSVKKMTIRQSLYA